MSDPRVWKYEVGMPDTHCRAWVYLPNGATPATGDAANATANEKGATDE